MTLIGLIGTLGTKREPYQREYAQAANSSICESFGSAFDQEDMGISSLVIKTAIKETKATLTDKEDLLLSNIIDVVSKLENNGAHLALKTHYDYFKTKHESPRSPSRSIITIAESMLNVKEEDLESTVALMNIV
ncbi:hypothetical protein MUCCIDRAFT_113703 [Mucor lusitanicus CBS 277.49]|uniref:Uncharacterized protein n=1 Tax=Mucor lusitanicus CBS 277.49 TaxID=747725 RepID=A0A168IQU9_MUCCL|nr:hypothetical protein MUCCIDRAFT_113703 [Mucor lusitanicus CBS 277.49]